MADPLYVLPDPLLALIQYLRLRSEVVALLPDSSHIATELPPTPVYPFVLLTLGGGTGIWPAIDDSAIQVDALGGTKEQCSLLARTVRAAIWGIRNDRVPSALLASGAEEIGPQWMPDTTTPTPVSRFVARYRVILHP